MKRPATEFLSTEAPGQDYSSRRDSGKGMLTAMTHESIPRTLGFLYPGHAAESDIPALCETLETPVTAVVVHTSFSGPNVEHRVDSLVDLGSEVRLHEAAQELVATGADVIVWACTSGSFVFGVEGAQRQVARLANSTGLPVSSASMAFMSAVKALGVTKVAVAATYPPDVSERFAEFLVAQEVGVASMQSWDILTAEEVGTITSQRVLDMVHQVDSPEAQAVLVPDTALHTVAHIRTLEAALDKPVLTANQVSVWEALRLTGMQTIRSGAGGLLFARERTGAVS